MAADNSPPRIQPIAITAFVAVLVLFGLKFVFDSYYLAMFEGEEYRKVGSVQPAELIALRAAEARSLASAPIPLEKAMQLVAKGRAEPMPGMKNDGIKPEPSTDTAAMIGWAQLAKPALQEDDSPAPPATSASAAPATSASAAPAMSASAAPAAAASSVHP